MYLTEKKILILLQILKVDLGIGHTGTRINCESESFKRSEQGNNGHLKDIYKLLLGTMANQSGTSAMQTYIKSQVNLS